MKHVFLRWVRDPKIEKKKKKVGVLFVVVFSIVGLGLLVHIGDPKP
jgi:hypothetical protein